MNANRILRLTFFCPNCNEDHVVTGQAPAVMAFASELMLERDKPPMTLLIEDDVNWVETQIDNMDAAYFPEPAPVIWPMFNVWRMQF